MYRLLKGLYSLKQSPRLWYERLCYALMELEFRKFNSSDCSFEVGNGSRKVLLMVYVDDLITMSPKNDTLEKKKDLVRHKFKLEDLGLVRYYLGIKF